MSVPQPAQQQLQAILFFVAVLLPLLYKAVYNEFRARSSNWARIPLEWSVATALDNIV